MPVVAVEECHTYADVMRKARESEARRKAWNKPNSSKSHQISTNPAPIIHNTAQVMWMGRPASKLWEEMFVAARKRIAATPEQNIDDVQARPTVAEIVRAAAIAYGFRSTDLKAARRDTASCHARHVSMLLSKLLTLRSLPDIGRQIGDRDHTTVLHGIRKAAGAPVKGVFGPSTLRVELEAIHTLADPISAWAATAARLYPIPELTRAYIRREKAEQ